jgi:hypothetical protein
MLSKRLITIGVLAVCAFATTTIRAEELVPFKGTWTGVTVSADLDDFPVISIVSAGGGEVSHLGNATMVSPHTTHFFTGDTAGLQIFTAANGDTLTAFCEGGATPPLPGESVVGELDCTITGGKGRFEGASGTYTFSFVASPRTDGGPGFATVATITGSISTVGSSN